MLSDIEAIAEAVVKNTNINKKKQLELKKELLSHLAQQQKDLQLAGHNENKTMAIIEERFGNQEMIGQELARVHSTFSTQKLVVIGLITWIFIVILLSRVQTGTNYGFIDCFRENPLSYCSKMSLTLVFLVSPIFGIVELFFTLFGWIFLCFMGISTAACYYFLPAVKIFRNKLAKTAWIQFVFSVALILQWLSLMFSYKRNNPYPINAIAQGGFPLKIFDYPALAETLTQGKSLTENLYTGLGYFYLNYFIWFVGAIILQYILPKKIKMNQNFLMILTIGGLLISLFGMQYLQGKFNY